MFYLKYHLYFTECKQKSKTGLLKTDEVRQLDIQKSETSSLLIETFATEMKKVC
jgi:hypothetical protein